MTESQLLDLLEKGKTGLIKGLIIPGKTEPVNGKLTLDGSFNIGIG